MFWRVLENRSTRRLSTGRIFTRYSFLLTPSWPHDKICILSYLLPPGPMIKYATARAVNSLRMSKLKPKKSTVRVERSAEQGEEPPPPSLILALVDCSLLLVTSPPGNTNLPLALTRGFVPLPITNIPGSLVLGVEGIQTRSKECHCRCMSRNAKARDVDFLSDRCTRQKNLYDSHNVRSDGMPTNQSSLRCCSGK